VHFRTDLLLKLQLNADLCSTIKRKVKKQPLRVRQAQLLVAVIFTHDSA